MPESDLDILLAAASEAGEIAKSFWGQSPSIWQKPDGAGPVSAADIAVNNMLQDRLCGLRPTYGWLSEETDDTAHRLDSECTFIIDPIDGTRSFLAGEKTWAHSLAVAKNGQIVAGVIFLPVLEKMYHGQIGQGAYFNGEPISHSPQPRKSDPTILAAKSVMKDENWRRSAPKLNRQFRPSLAYRMALVAQGRFDAMMTLRRTWEWDVAAGAIIASEAGATVTDQNGNDASFNNPIPALAGMIAAAPDVHRSIRDGLAL